MTIQQKKLLNPTHRQLLTGFVLYDCKGQGAKQKVAKRRLDMIEGNISSYSRILNDPQRLDSMRDLNKLTAAVASVSADKQEQLEKSKGKNKEKTKEKNKKKEEDEAKAAAKKEELLPKLTELMKPYVEGIVGFELLGQCSNKVLLQDIVKYYFNASPPKLRSMKKEDLLSFIKQRISPATATATATSTGGTTTATAMGTSTSTATATASIS
jgi:hypothetical protein